LGGAVFQQSEYRNSHLLADSNSSYTQPKVLQPKIHQFRIRISNLLIWTPKRKKNQIPGVIENTVVDTFHVSTFWGGRVNNN
jgi:hypothetical protein